MRSLTTVALLALAIDLSGRHEARAAPRLSLESVDPPGVVTSLEALKGLPRVLVFWRADCAPCLIELPMLQVLQPRLGPGRLVLVGLDDKAAERRILSQRAPDLRNAWHAEGDAARILSSFGGPPPRLPLAVAVDRAGRICARHHGLLGSNQIESWIAQCSA